MSRRRVEFQNSDGDTLSARLDYPADGKFRATALFAHCFTCSKSLNSVRQITSALADAGFLVMSFDFTGLGESEGDFADTNFSTNVADLLAASEYLGRELEAPRLLIGHSLGGAAVLMAQGRMPSVECVAVIAAPADPAHVTKNFADSVELLEREGQARVAIGGRPFLVKKQFLDDLRAADLDGDIARMGKALLVLHSPTDQVVGIENARRIFEAARHPKSFVSLDAADHLVSRPGDARFAARMIAAWADRYVGPEEEAAADLDSPQEGVLVRTGAVGYTTDVLTGRHHLMADEPVAVGGQDQGPGPYDFLLAGLGACTAMTLRMYADRKKIALQEVRVTLAHSRVHAADCEECETEDGTLSRIERLIEMRGDLKPEERARLMEIADRCPVHRTLSSEIIIETKGTD